MNGFERRKAHGKESILRAALDLFKTYGFKKVSMNDIAHKAGVSQVTIYNHFGSKDGLVREVIKNQFVGLLDKVREIMKQEKSFPEKLETIVFDKTNLARQYHGELLQAALQNDPQMQDWFQSLWQQDINQITIDLVEEGKKTGYINPKRSQESLMLYLEILRRGVFASSDVLANIEPNVELLRELNFLFIYGMMGK
jgi:AcrR family transcriptional regulator